MRLGWRERRAVRLYRARACLLASGVRQEALAESHWARAVGSMRIRRMAAMQMARREQRLAVSAARVDEIARRHGYADAGALLVALGKEVAAPGPRGAVEGMLTAEDYRYAADKDDEFDGTIKGRAVFIPDPDLGWVEVVDVRAHMRSGVVILDTRAGTVHVQPERRLYQWGKEKHRCD